MLYLISDLISTKVRRFFGGAPKKSAHRRSLEWSSAVTSVTSIVFTPLVAASGHLSFTSIGLRTSLCPSINFIVEVIQPAGHPINQTRGTTVHRRAVDCTEAVCVAAVAGLPLASRNMPALWPLRSLAGVSSRRPIEVVTIGFVAVTLAYFQLLHAVKHSEFLRPSSTFATPTGSSSSNYDGGRTTAVGAGHAASTAARLRPVTLQRYAGSAGQEDWQTSSSSSDAPTLSLARIVVSLDNEQVYAGLEEGQATQGHASSPTSFSSSLLDESNAASLHDFEKSLKLSSFGISATEQPFFQSVCHQVTTAASSRPQCLAYSFNPTSANPHSAQLTLGFPSPYASEEWMNAFLATTPYIDERGYTYLPYTELQSAPVTTAPWAAPSEQGVTWPLYALRAFFLRFYALAKVREAVTRRSFDIDVAIRLNRKRTQQTSLSCCLGIY